MKKFKFKMIHRYSNNYIVYETDEIEVSTPAFHETSYPILSGKYTYGVNGKNTAFATLFVKFPLTSGFVLRKHFRGNNAGQLARVDLRG